jgi:aminocarboxymuconate-semialdehyde decarboxylase
VRAPPGADDLPERTLEDHLRDMDASGVDLQVLSLTPRWARYDAEAPAGAAPARAINEQLAEGIARWPGRFAGLAHLPLEDPDAAVGELEHAVGKLGLAGAGVHTPVNGLDWDAERLFPILSAASRLEVPVFFHPRSRDRGLALGHHLDNLVGNAYETTVVIGSLVFGGVLDRLPELKACFAHGGGYAVFAAGRFDHGYRVGKARGSARPPSEYLRRLSFDCITHSETALRHLIDVVGAENVVLGTDYPAEMGIERPVEVVNRCSTLSADEKRAILSDNPRRLLGLRSISA